MSAAAPQSHEARLQRDGYCIIRNCLPRTTLTALGTDLDEAFRETPFGMGHFYGHRTKRFGSLLRRSHHVARLVLQPTILALARDLLGAACERIQLNVAQAISVHPGEIEQFPHRDHDMWPCNKNGQEFLINVIWPVSPFTGENGATRIYPGSHRQEFSSIDELDRPVIAECGPGDAIIFLGSTVHGAGPNTTQAERRAVVIGYSLGWLKPYESNLLAYPPSVAASFPRELAELVGYAQHRPNLGNYEGQCPSILLADEVPTFLQAVDALRPDQEEAVRHFAKSQRTGG
jgi:ectoine hydroxylase-related dioxygenase (phytanoyl-CoA dioxygenase family)